MKKQNNTSRNSDIKSLKLFTEKNVVFMHDEEKGWYPINFYWKPLVKLNSSFNSNKQ